MKTMRLILTFILSIAAAVFSRAEPVEPTPAPAFTLKDLAGKDVSLAQFKGKLVVVDFWATWCGPCRHEIPGYIELQRKYGKDGLAIIGIAVSDKAEAVKNYAAQQGINYTIVMGNDAVVEAFGGIEGIPTTFIIDRQGRIRDKKVGALDSAEYEQILLKYLK